MIYESEALLTSTMIERFLEDNGFKAILDILEVEDLVTRYILKRANKKDRVKIKSLRAEIVAFLGLRDRNLRIHNNKTRKNQIEIAIDNYTVEERNKIN